MATIPFDEAAGQHWRIEGDITPDGRISLAHDNIQLLLLQEIRDELKKLNALLHCPNFQNIPAKLDAIRRKLPTRKKRARKA